MVFVCIVGIIAFQIHDEPDTGVNTQCCSIVILTICIFNPLGILFFHLESEGNENKRLKIRILLIDSEI